MTARPNVRPRPSASISMLLAVLALVFAGVGPVAARPHPGDGDRGSDESSGRTTERFVVVDHNIENRDSALERALTRARRAHADGITLQEVCKTQMSRLRRKHPRWTVAWKPDRANDRCQRQADQAGAVLGERDPRKDRNYAGNVAIWTGGSRGNVQGFTFRHQFKRGFRHGVACVTFRQGFDHRVCSVHLLANQTSRRVRVRTAQARELRTLTDPWIRADDLVVLGGDFNASPGKREMDYLYKFNGLGSFRELTPRPRGGSVDCRCDDGGSHDGGAKIDYIFFSDNRMGLYARRSMTLIRTASDHHLLSAWAFVSNHA